MTSIFTSSSCLSVRLPSTLASPEKEGAPVCGGRLSQTSAVVFGAALATLPAVETFLVNLLPSRVADAWFYERRFFGRAEKLG